jgi:hypothetical protein
MPAATCWRRGQAAADAAAAVVAADAAAAEPVRFFRLFFNAHRNDSHDSRSLAGCQRISRSHVFLNLVNRFSLGTNNTAFLGSQKTSFARLTCT